MKQAVLGLLCWASGAGMAAATCQEPDFFSAQPDTYLEVPDIVPEDFARPEMPFCYANFEITGRHECESWEVEDYRAEVERYVFNLKEYAADALEFARAADRVATAFRDYADRAEEFARDARDFRKCETRDARNEFER